MDVSSMVSIKYIILAAVLIGAGALIGVIVRSVRRTAHSAEAKVISDIINIATEKGLAFDYDEDRPKKLSNMNKIYRPVIEKDFPDFDWNEERRRIDAAIREKYADKIDFTIYDTVIARYERFGGSIVITTETAASYFERDNKEQLVIQTELSYVNFKKLSDSGEEVPRALTCPRCGAPLTREKGGDVRCEFCNTIVVGEKQWQITDMKEK